MVAMSRKLDATLVELTITNVKLQEDVEEKKRNEELRKELVATSRMS